MENTDHAAARESSHAASCPCSSQQTARPASTVPSAPTNAMPLSNGLQQMMVARLPSHHAMDLDPRLPSWLACWLFLGLVCSCQTNY